MLDFIKIVLSKKYRGIISNNDLLEFIASYSVKTGELKSNRRGGKKATPFEVAYYKGMEFRIYPNLVVITGSLHKYWNNGLHNYNDFTEEACRKVINEIINIFHINPEEARINQLEVGVNFSPPYSTKKILSHMYFHRRKPIERNYTMTEGNYYQAEHQQYYIKVYDKKKQYERQFNLKNDILRFEIKGLGGRLKRKGIETLQDIIEYSFKTFVNDLQEEFKNILFYDWTIESKSVKIKDYSNPLYWEKLIEERSYSTYHKHLKRLAEFTSTRSQNIQNICSNILYKKGLELLSGGYTNYDYMYSSNSNTPTLEKICPITGLIIKEQRKDSEVLSIGGIRYYKKHNYNVYRQLELKYLTSYWRNENESIKIREIAHQIRNVKYNGLHRKEKFCTSNQLRLI